MYFVPEGQHDRGLARSAWDSATKSAVPVGERTSNFGTDFFGARPIVSQYHAQDLTIKLSRKCAILI